MKAANPRVSLQHAVHLGPEDDEGSVEYKWKLVGVTEDRFEHLVSQMQFRVAEGNGECLYEVGVADDGFAKGLAEAEFQETFATLRRMAARLQYDLSVVHERVVQTSPLLKCAEVCVRKFGADDFIDVRISVCGHAGSGKSTLVGVLTRGVLDSGQGSARQRVFNHLHELETGRTSSISQQILGFGAGGDVVNYAPDQLVQLSLERIAEMSAKVCTLYDLAGHEKYLKTTVTGMTGSGIDYACLVIRADKGIQQMTREHLGLCCSLEIPFFIVVTAADLLDAAGLGPLHAAIDGLLTLPTVPREAFWVKDRADVLVSVRGIKCGMMAPVFLTSNVTGKHLDLLSSFLNFLPARREWDELAKRPLEIVLDRWYDQAAAQTTVVSGLVEQGAVVCGDALLLGPDHAGAFAPVVVTSIQMKRVNVRKAEAGMHATYAVSKPDGTPVAIRLRKGMLLAAPALAPALAAVWRFEADLTILFALRRIQTNFQPTFHCRMIRQKVRLLLLDCTELRSQEQSRVQFEFLFTAECLKEGLNFVVMDGGNKGIGTITRLIQLDAPPPRHTAPKATPRGRCRSTGVVQSAAARPRFFSGSSATDRRPRAPPPSAPVVGAAPAGPPCRVVSFHPALADGLPTPTDQPAPVPEATGPSAPPSAAGPDADAGPHDAPSRPLRRRRGDNNHPRAVADAIRVQERRARKADRASKLEAEDHEFNPFAD